MDHPRKKFLFWILIPIVGVGILLFLTVRYLFDPHRYSDTLQKTLSAQLGKEVTFGRATVWFWGGVGIALEDFRIKDRTQSYDLFYSQRLILTAKTLPLLKREVQWKRVTIEKPVGRFSRDRDGRFNFFDTPLTGEALKSSQQKIVETLSTLFGGTLSIRSGEFFFSDDFLGGEPIVTEIKSLDLRLSKISFETPFPFRIQGKLLHSRREGDFSISGTLEGISKEMDFSKGKVKAEVNIKGMEIFHFWPYFKSFLPMNKVAGVFNLKGRYEGNLSGPFIASAKIQLREVTYDHPKVFAYVFTPQWIGLDLQARYERETFEVPKCSIELPEIKIRAKGKIYGIGTKEMGMEAEASSNVFDLADGRRFIPFRIITPSVSEPLFRAEGSGPVQILSVKLSGKMPEIDHCDELTNAHVLRVEMKVHNARLKLPWNLPALEDLKGHLLFKQGHLHLSDVTGRVFHSSIDRASGIFYELLQVPTLEVQGQGQFQLADLFPLLKTDIFANDTDTTNALGPIRSLSGKAHYQLSVKGKLKSPLHFKHQGSYLLSKVHLTHAKISFPVFIGEGKVDLSNEDFHWSGARVEFGNSALLMSGSLKRGGVSEITAKGKIDLKNLLALWRSPLFLEETTWKTEDIEGLSGTGQFSFWGRKATPFQPFSYELDFIPKDASILFKGKTSPIHFRDGSLSISNLGATFSKLKIQSLNTSLTLDGTVQQGELNLSTSGSIDLKHISTLLPMPFFPDSVRTLLYEMKDAAGFVELRLNWSGNAEKGIDAIKDGEILMKGVSLRHEKIPFPLSQIEGKILLFPHQMQWDKVKGRLGDSWITLSIASSRTPEESKETGSGLVKRLFLHLTSPELNLPPLFPEKDDQTPASFEKIRQWLTQWAIEGRVDVGKGRYQHFDFEGLRFEMRMAGGRLILRPFELKANGGDLWGEAWIEPSERGIRFEMRPRLSHMETAPFLRTLLKKEEREKVFVTGRLYIDRVKLGGEGENFQKIKESLQGGLRVELENGVIEKANILSKIFSILNVSQLFKGRFPDLRTRGLPYQRISATFQVKEGIASTEDFLVDSDAMRITAIGKVDLGKHLIDAKVGVHPLGTVDTILSNIPIAGYILTGKDKAFLSYVYEVKGDLDDPKIEAIPFKAAGEGVIGIFKRLLETPLRPFQKNNADKK